MSSNDTYMYMSLVYRIRVGGQGLLHNMSSQGKGGGGTLIYNLIHNVNGGTGEGWGPFLGGYYVYGGGGGTCHTSILQWRTITTSE